MKNHSNDWRGALDSTEELVMVTMVESTGSLPRKAGAKIFITKDKIWGTVGGGIVEKDLIDRAKSLLGTKESQLITINFDPSIDPLLACGGQATFIIDSI